MTREWQMVLSPHSSTAAMALPPPLVEETAWDILLALHSDQECKLSLLKLASLVSVSHQVLSQWLTLLEKRRWIAGERSEASQELRAVLTHAGRELLDRYLSVTNDLQTGARP